VIEPRGSSHHGDGGLGRPLQVVGPAVLLLEGAMQAGPGLKPPGRRGVMAKKAKKARKKK